MAAYGPLIPERLIDAPSQRLYILSLGLALQALKLVAFFTSLIEGNSLVYFLKWMLVDIAFLLVLRFLRIPRLTFRWQSSALQTLILAMLNWLLFGNYTISFSTASVVPALVYDVWMRFRGDYVGINGYTVSFTELLRGDKHLIGQHTVKLSPISTAKLNPYLESICIPSHLGYAFVPVLLNNTDPSQITYTLTEHTSDPSTKSRPSSTVILKKKDILTRIDWTQSETPTEEGGNVVTTLSEDEAFDLEFGESEDPRAVAQHHHHQSHHQKAVPELQRTQLLRWIKVTKPGTIKLDSVVDGRTDVRLREVEVPVVICPIAQFTANEEKGEVNAEKVVCRGDSEQLVMLMRGVPPMKLEYQRVLGNHREETTVEGLDPNHKEGDERSLTPTDLKIPLGLTLTELGEHIYTLTSITDGLGNTVDLTLPPSPHLRHKFTPDITRTICVLRPAEFSFHGCRPGHTVDLIQGRETNLQLMAGYYDRRDGPWKLFVQFTPAASLAATGGEVVKAGKATRDKAGWTREINTTEKSKKFLAEASGEYKLLSAQGQICKGDVLSPEVCRVVEVPMPKADIEWRPLHECSGDVGVTANLVLHGTPPFRVFHKTTHNGHETTNSTTINGSRGEITLQPERSGSYVYQFTALSDAHYKNVPLRSEPIKQTVHPLANAGFVGKGTGSRETTVQSCSGNVVDVPVNLIGSAPWTLELQVVGPGGVAEKLTMKGIKKNQHTLQIKIPDDVDREGGTIQVDLISVEDATGCKRSLTVPGVTVNVRRVKPTAKFYAKDGKRHVEILMSETANLPLRLTGDGPWQIEYRDLRYPRSPKRERIQSANGVIPVQAEGTYEITAIRDAQCPGIVLVPEHTYTVAWVPRPAVRILDTVRTPQVANGSYIRPPICVLAEDHIMLSLEGSPPFQVNYEIKRGKERPDMQSFTSLQTEHRVQLQTAQPGRVVYEITAVGDAKYSVKDEHIRSSKDHPRWEQQVLARPAAYFKTAARLSYCLNDALVPRPESHLNQDGVVVFEGKAPFTVAFSIHNLASSETRQETRVFNSHEWHLDFAEYIFSTVGSYLITIDSVRDASSCEEIVDETAQRSIWADVAETAMIVPFERRTDVCVGDLLQFQLEGMAPWTITYRFNNKVQKTIQKTPKYTTVANVAGEFSVVSIAHQQAQCQTSVSDVRLMIHEIPSAQVSHGSRFEENIREGEQAEIVFTLIGEPPFTFTYQRAELGQYARGRKPKILETHTVAGVTASEYSIFSSAEGTWTVTFISDKWCRYPPAKTDPSIEAV